MLARKEILSQQPFKLEIVYGDLTGYILTVETTKIFEDNKNAIKTRIHQWIKSLNSLHAELRKGGRIR